MIPTQSPSSMRQGLQECEQNSYLFHLTLSSATKKVLRYELLLQICVMFLLIDLIEVHVIREDMCVYMIHRYTNSIYGKEN